MTLVPEEYTILVGPDADPEGFVTEMGGRDYIYVTADWKRALWRGEDYPVGIIQMYMRQGHWAVVDDFDTWVKLVRARNK